MKRNLKRNIVIAAVLVFVGAAVYCYTGLGADKIVIYKMTESEG